jgi:hypothetical protein
MSPLEFNDEAAAQVLPQADQPKACSFLTGFDIRDGSSIATCKYTLKSASKSSFVSCTDRCCARMQVDGLPRSLTSLSDVTIKFLAVLRTAAPRRAMAKRIARTRIGSTPPRTSGPTSTASSTFLKKKNHSAAATSRARHFP